MDTKITTVEVEKNLHTEIRELSDSTGIEVRRLVAILIEDGMKQFKERFEGLIRKK